MEHIKPNLISAVYNTMPFVKSIFYMIDWKTKETQDIPKWLNMNLIVYDEILRKTLADNKLIDFDSDGNVNKDITKMKITKWIRTNIKYTRDITQYKTSEYWATVGEILESMEDDCEGGATLDYCLSIKAGIPKEQVFFCAGNVQSSNTAPVGGHAWVRYVSENWPTVAWYTDWCYYPSLVPIGKRRTSYYDWKGFVELPSDSRYKKFWFICNHNTGFRWI